MILKGFGWYKGGFCRIFLSKSCMSTTEYVLLLLSVLLFFGNPKNRSKTARLLWKKNNSMQNKAELMRWHITLSKTEQNRVELMCTFIDLSLFLA